MRSLSSSMGKISSRSGDGLCSSEKQLESQRWRLVHAAGSPAKRTRKYILRSVECVKETPNVNDRVAEPRGTRTRRGVPRVRDTRIALSRAQACRPDTLCFLFVACAWRETVALYLHTTVHTDSRTCDLRTCHLALTYSVTRRRPPMAAETRASVERAVPGPAQLQRATRRETILSSYSTDSRVYTAEHT